jgi:hypothetical protein
VAGDAQKTVLQQRPVVIGSKRGGASMTTTNDEARRAQLKSTSEAYFAGLAKRDVSSVPWHDDILLRSPSRLKAPMFPCEASRRSFSGSRLCSRSLVRPE